MHLGVHKPVNKPCCMKKSVLNRFPNKPWFLCVYRASLLKTLGKGEIARNEQFLLFPQCFLPFGELSTIFIRLEIAVCKLFHFRSV